MAEKTTEYRELQDQTMGVMRECDKMGAMVGRVSETTQRNSGMFATLESDASGANNVITTLESKISALAEREKREEAALTEVTGNVTEAYAAIHECEAAALKLEKQKNELQHAFQAARDTLEKSRSERGTLDREIANATEHMENLKQLVEEAPRNIDKEAEALANLKKEKKRLKKQKSVIKKHREKTSRDLETIESAFATAQQKVAELEQCIEEKRARQRDLVGPVNLMERDKTPEQAADAVAAEVSQVQQKLHDLTALQTDRARLMAEQQMKVTSSKSGSKILEEQHANVQAEKIRHEQAAHILAQKKAYVNNEFLARQAEFSRTMEDWNREKSTLFDKKSSSLQQFNDLQQQIIAIDAEVRSFTADINDLTLNIDLHHKRRDADKKLQKRIAKKEAEIDSQMQAEKQRVQSTHLDTGKSTILPNARANRSRTLQLD